MTFVYCQCPDCLFDVVIDAAVVANGEKIACPMCFEDRAGALVPMTERPAEEGDKPEGPDGRRHLLPRYTCDACGKEAISGATDQQAADEFMMLNDRPYDPRRDQTLCDQCFKERRRP